MRFYPLLPQPRSSEVWRPIIYVAVLVWIPNAYYFIVPYNRFSDIVCFHEVAVVVS